MEDATRSLKSLPLSSLTLQKLDRNGFKTFGDLEDVSAEDLVTEIQVSLAEAGEIIARVKGSYIEQTQTQAVPLLSSSFLPSQRLFPNPITSQNLPPSTLLQPIFPLSSQITHQTASQLLAATFSLPTFSLCPSIDSCLFANSPIKPGSILEATGPPGSGKTSALVSLLMDARVGAVKRAREEGGMEEKSSVGEEVLVVDTEGDLSRERLKAAAEVLAGRGETEITPKQILAGIHHLRLHTLSQFVAFLSTLDNFLSSNRNINLIVIDTLSYHLRSPTIPPDTQSRNRILQQIKQTFQRCSSLYRVAIVASVQVASKFLDADGNATSFDKGMSAKLHAQLGELWQPPKTQRVIFFYAGTSRDYLHPIRYAALLPLPGLNQSSSLISGANGHSPAISVRGGWKDGFRSREGGLLVQSGGGSNSTQVKREGAGGIPIGEGEWARFEISADGLLSDVDEEG